ncbi:MAG: exosome subunit [Candidatus Methanoperedens sp.]|nr:exosome subunit [Candidatus Methanoperedens sp.]MCZ7397340.1 exosome subunit [Candidatus Methanoperedens sp.]
MDIHNITLRAISQATESEDRVRTALSLFLSGEQIEIINTEGHFGNPISILQARIKGKDCSRFIELFGSKLSESELNRLKNEASDRVDDDCTLHIRFDKQAAYKGTMQLASTKDAISVEIKLKAYPARQENAIATAEKIFSKIGN